MVKTTLLLKTSKHTAEYYKAEIERITQEEGIPVETLQILMASIKNAFSNYDKVGPKEVVRQFIEDLLMQDSMLQYSLEYLKITDSVHLGRLMHQLVDLGVYQADPGDELENFEGIFETSKIKEYLKKERLKDVKARIKKFSYVLFAISGICWILWMTEMPEDYLIIIGCTAGFMGYSLYYRPDKTLKFLKKG